MEETNSLDNYRSLEDSIAGQLQLETVRRRRRFPSLFLLVSRHLPSCSVRVPLFSSILPPSLALFHCFLHLRHQWRPHLPHGAFHGPPTPASSPGLASAGSQLSCEFGFVFLTQCSFQSSEMINRSWFLGFGCRQVKGRRKTSLEGLLGFRQIRGQEFMGMLLPVLGSMVQRVVRTWSNKPFSFLDHTVLHMCVSNFLSVWLIARIFFMRNCDNFRCLYLERLYDL